MQTQFDPDSTAAWHVRLFKKSAARKAVLDQIQRLLPPTEGLSCLDIGGGDGMIPTMLHKRGGHWISADRRPGCVAFMQEIFGEDNVVHLADSSLPFENSSFDVIVVMEHLVWLREDALFVKECHRVLRTGGCLILHTPHIKSFSLANGLRGALGIRRESRGFLRTGYKLRDLYEISKSGFDIVESRTYGGFLEEAVGVFLEKVRRELGPESGDTPQPAEVPDQQTLRTYSAWHRRHLILYPLQVMGRGLDNLFRFTCNHYLVIQLKPRPWMERRGVQMRDGRSIADAAINTKIGTAADLTDPKNNRS